MKKLLFKIAGVPLNGPYSSAFRAKRLDFFMDLVKKVEEKSLSILDVGGTVSFWNTISFPADKKIRVVVLNIMEQKSDNPSIETIVGDGRDLSRFATGEFGIVFSNSVIEHVGSYGDQEKMAKEVRRVGKRYFVQTPDYYFPIEPHFLFPCFQFFPVALRAFLLRHFSLGHYRKTVDSLAAIAAVSQIRLLRLSELRVLFPDAQIYRERFLGLTKSFVLYRM